MPVTKIGTKSSVHRNSAQLTFFTKGTLVLAKAMQAMWGPLAALSSHTIFCPSGVNLGDLTALFGKESSTKEKYDRI